MEEILDTASGVTETDGGYTFAVVLLTATVITLCGVVWRLWVSYESYREEYITLTTSISTILSEVNLKLDQQDKIKSKIEEIHKDILTNKNCKYDR